MNKKFVVSVLAGAAAIALGQILFAQYNKRVGA